MVKVLAAALLLSVGLYAASAAQAQTAIGPAPTVAPVAAKLPAVAPWAVSREGVVTPEHASAQVLPSTPAPAGLYVAMGDSITYGVGIKQNCAAFPAHPVDIASFCPEGQSYAILTALLVTTASVNRPRNVARPPAFTVKVLPELRFSVALTTPSEVGPLPVV